MTAPVGDDLTALLDELERAHAAAAVALPLAQSPDFATWVEEWQPDGGARLIAECYGEERAALIVAAVNAVPTLIAALRDVVELHDCDEEDLCGLCRVTYPCRTVRALTAALTPESVPT